MYSKNDQVYWITGNCAATVIRETEFGDVIVFPSVGMVPITTRACFLIPVAS